MFASVMLNMKHRWCWNTAAGLLRLAGTWSSQPLSCQISAVWWIDEAICGGVKVLWKKESRMRRWRQAGMKVMWWSGWDWRFPGERRITGSPQGTRSRDVSEFRLSLQSLHQDFCPRILHHLRELDSTGNMSVSDLSEIYFCIFAPFNLFII